MKTIILDITKKSKKFHRSLRRVAVLKQDCLYCFNSMEALDRGASPKIINLPGCSLIASVSSSQSRTVELKVPNRSHGRISIHLDSLPEAEAAQTVALLREACSSSAGQNSSLVSTDAPVDDESVGLKDFELLDVIGEGAFGDVVRCRHKASNDMFAMKVVSKKQLQDMDMQESSLQELNALKALRKHPFCVGLHYAFNTPANLHFVMDLCTGGNLSRLLQEQPQGRFAIDTVRFFAAEIALAVGHLHHHNIIYRDLKLSNILLDADGHVRLADFGLVKVGGAEGAVDAVTMCGTEGYMAPEMFERRVYGREADWWSFGCALMIMVCGGRFARPVLKDLAQTRRLLMPRGMDPDAKDLITRLLIKNQVKRLGYNGVEEVKAHPFFASIDWTSLLQKRVSAPLNPHIMTPVTTSRDVKDRPRPSLSDVSVKGSFGTLKDFTFAKTPAGQLEGRRINGGAGAASGEGGDSSASTRA